MVAKAKLCFIPTTGQSLPQFMWKAEVRRPTYGRWINCEIGEIIFSDFYVEREIRVHDISRNWRIVKIKKKTISKYFFSRVFPPNTASIFLEIRLNRRNRKSAITEFRQIFLCSGGSFGALQRDQIGRF